jgi:oxalate decarboxylase/phosphoglucose isomerase-like protein (cupin superfamily)
MFTVAGGLPLDLDGVADQLRRKIDQIPQGQPLLAAQRLGGQSGVEEYLVVVRTHEEPHIHPDGDLIVCTLQGGGYFQLDKSSDPNVPETADAPAGSVAVIPKGVCHAFHNTAPTDTVLFATFSPKNSKADCPTVT